MGKWKHEYQYQYYLKNKERLSNYQHNWYIKNKERVNKKNNEWYQNNKDKRSISIKKWQLANFSRFKILCKKWREENKVIHSKQKSDWKKANKGRVVLYTERRRSWEVGAGELTLKTIQQVYEDNIKRFGTLTCVLCNKPIEFGKDSLEHLIPLSRGGKNSKENLAIAHLLCNIRKGKKTLTEWENYYGEIISERCSLLVK